MTKAAYRCLLFPAILFSMFFIGCNEEDCLSDTTSEVVFSFADSVTEEPVLETFTRIRITGSDFNFIPTEPLANFSLPINPHDNKISYIFTSPETTETLTLIYARKPRILAVECPHEVRYENLQIVAEETTFLNVKLINSELTNTAIPNVTIYR